MYIIYGMCLNWTALSAFGVCQWGDLDASTDSNREVRLYFWLSVLAMANIKEISLEIPAFQQEQYQVFQWNVAPLHAKTPNFVRLSVMSISNHEMSWAKRNLSLETFTLVTRGMLCFSSKKFSEFLDFNEAIQPFFGGCSRQELRHAWPVLFHCLSAFGPLAARAVQIFATLVESEEAPHHMTKVLQCSLDAVDEARKPLTRNQIQMEFEKFDKCQNCQNCWSLQQVSYRFHTFTAIHSGTHWNRRHNSSSTQRSQIINQIPLSQVGGDEIMSALQRSIDIFMDMAPGAAGIHLGVVAGLSGSFPFLKG